MNKPKIKGDLSPAYVRYSKNAQWYTEEESNPQESVSYLFTGSIEDIELDIYISCEKHFETYEDAKAYKDKFTSKYRTSEVTITKLSRTELMQYWHS